MGIHDALFVAVRIEPPQPASINTNIKMAGGVKVQTQNLSWKFCDHIGLSIFFQALQSAVQCSGMDSSLVIDGNIFGRKPCPFANSLCLGQLLVGRKELEQARILGWILGLGIKSCGTTRRAQDEQEKQGRTKTRHSKLFNSG